MGLFVIPFHNHGQVWEVFPLDFRTELRRFLFSHKSISEDRDPNILGSMQITKLRFYDDSLLYSTYVCFSCPQV